MNIVPSIMVAMLLLPGLAHAASVYVGVGAGVDQYIDPAPSEDEVVGFLIQAGMTGVSETTELTTVGGKLFAGIRWPLGPLPDAPNLGIELGYVRFGDYKADYSFDRGSISVQSEISGWTTSLVLDKNIAENTSLFGKAGALLWDVDQYGKIAATVGRSSSSVFNDSGVGFTAGAGIEYALTRQFHLRSELEYFFDVGQYDTTMATDIGQLSVSGMYGF
ncbi:MAG: hypothetical protein HQL84_05885 [Magnetococcales bacterium]|nr:hypothetical protein [Magnetococcales bacterium]MBF0149562.1 hypothetical protein [Magnetococcales bacterium]MBF0346890.1 hypothetical protein [Magnetococcales bacterium]MBF0632075.1 hypothetical protein [Magnetococcales bacterium]